jgi:hypothetical protein
MAIRLGHSTQKDTQASAASFGLGLDHGDGGARAIQGALGQVAHGTKEIAGNLERKDRATQEGNRKRKGAKMEATWNEMIREGDLLVKQKEFGKLAKHKEMMKAWSENAHVNDVQFNTDGDTSVRDEYANPINEHFKTDYDRVAHDYDMASLTGAMVHEAEVIMERSGTILERDVAANSVSSKTGEGITDHLGIYFHSGAFAESNPQAQEIYVAKGTEQMGAYVDAMRFAQERNPNIADAQQQLKDASEQVREAKWMGVDAQNAMLDRLGIQFKAIESGQSVYRTLNDFGQAGGEAASSGYADRNMDTITQQYLAAKKVVKPLSDEDKNLDSSYLAYGIQAAMNGSEQRQWMVDNPTGKISDLPGIDKSVLNKVDRGDMNNVLATRNTIVKAYKDARDRGGAIAAERTLYPHAAGVFHSADATRRAMTDKLAAGGSLDESDKATLRREARTEAQIMGQLDPALGPGSLVLGGDAIIGADIGLQLVKDNPENAGAAVDVLVASNDGLASVPLWSAINGDTTDPDMKVFKSVAQARTSIAEDDFMTSVIAAAAGPSARSLLGKGSDAEKMYDAVYAKLTKKNDSFSVITGAHQAYARDYGSPDEAITWATYEQHAIAKLVSEHGSGQSPDWYINEAKKHINGMARVYEGSDGRRVMLFRNAVDSLGEQGVQIHASRVSAYMSELGDRSGSEMLLYGFDTSTPSEEGGTAPSDMHITQEEATDMMYHWAGEYVKEHYNNIVEQWAAGLKKGGYAESEAAQEQIRKDYPPELLLREFKLSTEMISPTTKEREMAFLMPQINLGGVSSGYQTVKMDSSRGAKGQMPSRGVFAPVDEMLKKIQDPAMHKLYREQRDEIESRLWKYQVERPAKDAARAVKAKTASAARFTRKHGNIQGIMGALDRVEDSVKEKLGF